ncbi:DUF2057 domain-containing protein [Vibrio sp. AK197]
MNKLKAWIVLAVMFGAGGCSTLNSTSEFTDVIKSTTERRDFVQVTGKSITPETQALSGQNIVKSQLSYIGVFPKSGQETTKSSSISGEVSYFKNYDHFSYVQIGQKRYQLTNDRPIAETCTEHCTVSQWFTFPISEQYIDSEPSEFVEFTLTAENHQHTVKFSIPKAYFSAVRKEATYLNESPNHDNIQSQSAQVTSQVSRAQEMITYWYDKASTTEQGKFRDWAFVNRNSINTKMVTQSQPTQMLSYWYEQASSEEKKQILAWLLDTE